MRIISGSLKGRVFAEPHGFKTHPMSEKIRGALFNTLGDIEDLTVLDAFAGSGALSFEAASRGATKIVAIEKDGAAHSVIEKNLKDLNLQSAVKVIRANAGGWSLHNLERKFDIVLMDPPYKDLQYSLLEKLINRHVNKNGLAVLSLPGQIEIPAFDNVTVISNKNYGDAQLVFYRKIK
jgi:16S rRNA (guanine966-N2)-methyltransferase